MTCASITYQYLTPDVQLDALASIGIYPDTGLLALNSYENRVYSFTDEQQHRYVVKFYRPQRWTEQQILEEHAFCQKLSDADLLVSAPLVFQNNTLHSFAGFSFAMFDNLSARSLAVDDMDSLYYVGIALGKLHKISSQHQFSHRPTLDINETIEQASKGLVNCKFIPDRTKAPFFEVLDNIRHKIASLHLAPPLPIAIHGDAHASNILLKNEQPHWVDFDDCRMGPAIQDIWMLLSGDRREQQLQLSMIIEGYQEEYNFDLSQLSQIEALRCMRIINYVHWIHHRWDDPAFSINFPWFTTDQYWQDLLQSLQQQLVLLNEAPLSLQPQY